MATSFPTSFKDFFERWLAEQDRHLDSLISAATAGGSDVGGGSCSLRVLTGQVMEHYEQYYRTKSAWAHRDVLSVLSPKWKTTLEEVFLWIGGWRPSAAFHLLYSKSGLQLESLIRDPSQREQLARSGADLAGLSARQYGLIDELQRNTIKIERRITEKMAKIQESVADATMVDLSHKASEMMRMGHVDHDVGPIRVVNDRVERALVPKERKMEEVLRAADDLRLMTLRSIVDDTLTPIQAVHFLIAVAELHLRFHDWGKQRDDQR